jgi:Glycosyl transferase family 2
MKTESPRFSVLLPTHNRGDVLGFAIASVLDQSEPDFELLIVADGCTDSTSDIVASFADPRIRFFDLPKAPYFGYANRNVALRQARGRLVAFAAHDDLLLPDHLALMGDLLEHNGAAWGYSRPLWVSTDGVIVPFCTNLCLADELQSFQHGNTIPAGCVVHLRAALEQVGFWPEDVPSAADWVLWRKMIISGGSAAHLRQPTNLHFSANWKKSRFSGVSEVKVLLEIADNASWWPSILRHTPNAESEQATIWRAIKVGRDPWVKKLREATETVIDRIAWMAVRDLQPRIETALAAQARLEALAETALAAQARSEALAETFQAEVEALRTSTSWRITAPLRSIARLLP